MTAAAHAVFLAGFALGCGLTLAVLFLWARAVGVRVEAGDPHDTEHGDEPYLAPEVRRALHPEAYERLGATPPALRENFHGHAIAREGQRDHG